MQKTKRLSPDGPTRKRKHCLSGKTTTDDEDPPLKRPKLNDSQRNIPALEKRTSATSLGTPLSVDSGHTTLMSPQNIQPCLSVDSGLLTMSPSIGTQNPWSVDGYISEDILASNQHNRQTTEFKEYPRNCSNSKQVKKFLQRNFSLLKEELFPGKIPAYLYQEGVIEKRMYEAIETEKRREDKCEALLLALSYDIDEAKNLDTMQILKMAFEREGYKHLVEDIGSVPDEEMIQLVPSDKAERRLNEYKELLERDLDPEMFIDQLVDYGVLSVADHKNIRSVAYRPEKVQTLIKYVKRNISRNFAALCNSVKVYYSDIYRLLTEEDTEKETNNEVLLHMQMMTNPVLKSSQTAQEDGNSQDVINVRLQLGGCDENVLTRKKIEKQIVNERLVTERNLQLYRKVNKLGTQIKELSLGSIKLRLFTKSHKAKYMFFKTCHESPVFLQDVLRGLITPRHAQRLREANVDKVDIDVAITFPDQIPCRSVLSKELIVKEFTYIEEHMQDIEAILKEFVKTEEAIGVESRFSEILVENTTQREKNGRFLMTVLSMPEFPNSEDFGLCLLERKLRDTEQKELLKHIMSSDCLEEPSVTIDDIRRNYSLIVNEIEPRRFIKMMQTIHEDKVIHEQILSSPKRKDRCQVLLDFVFRTGQSAVSDFMSALKLQGLSHLIEAINDSAHEAQPHVEENLRETLLLSYEEVESEVEPIRLLPFLKQRNVLSEEDALEMSKYSTRTQRIVWLMNKALEIPRVSDMVECLKLGGYTKLANSIYSKKDDYRDCPRHTQDTSNAGETVVLKTSFKIGFIQSEPSQSTKKNESAMIDKRPVTEETIPVETPQEESSMYRKSFTENWIWRHMETFVGEADSRNVYVPIQAQIESDSKGIHNELEKVSPNVNKRPKVDKRQNSQGLSEERTVSDNPSSPSNFSESSQKCCDVTGDERPSMPKRFKGHLTARNITVFSHLS